MTKSTLVSILTLFVASSMFSMGCGDTDKPHSPPVVSKVVKCADNPCKNGGTCTDTTTGFMCSCSFGVEGEKCEKVKTCSETPGVCKNGGTCVDGASGLSCQCPVGYDGNQCENVKTCADMTGLCQHGGTCVDGITGVSCQCPLGYDGKTCEVVKKCADLPDACHNNGTCTDEADGVKCHCREGVDGESCEHVRPFKIKVKVDESDKFFSIFPGIDEIYFIHYEKDYSRYEGFDYNVDCDSDGTLEAVHVTKDVTANRGFPASYRCDYPSAGEYTISISGNYPGLFFAPTFPAAGSTAYYNAAKIIDVVDWGGQKWEIMSYMFYGATNLTSFSSKSKPNLSVVANMSHMFRDATLFNGDISGWDVSNVRDMFDMFRDATAFNGDISRWKVSRVKSCNNFAYGTTSWNKTLWPTFDASCGTP